MAEPVFCRLWYLSDAHAHAEGFAFQQSPLHGPLEGSVLGIALGIVQGRAEDPFLGLPLVIFAVDGEEILEADDPGGFWENFL